MILPVKIRKARYFCHNCGDILETGSITLNPCKCYESWLHGNIIPLRATRIEIKIKEVKI